MSIALRSTGTIQENGSQGTTIEIPAPGTIVDGDLLVIFVNASQDNAFTDGEGDWTEDTELQSNVAGDSTIAIYYKIASSESGSYTINFGESAWLSGFCVALSGIDTTQPDAASTTTGDIVNDSTPDGPSITTVTDGAWVFSFIGGTQTGTSAKVQPTGYTLLGQTQNADDFCVGYKEVATAGAEDPGAMSGFASTSDVGAITFAVRPLVASGGSEGAALHRHLQNMGYR